MNKEKAISKNEQVKVPPKQKVVKEKVVSTLIYCGPSLPNLKQHATFIGKLPRHVQVYCEKSDAVKNLFIPVTNFAKFRRDITREGTLQHKYYQRAIEYMKEGQQ